LVSTISADAGASPAAANASAEAAISRQRDRRGEQNGVVAEAVAAPRLQKPQPAAEDRVVA
jgi:hypothetical protein